MTLTAFGVLLESVRGLSWPSRRRATGTLPGSHRSRLRGTAPELAEYRLYRQGDEPRQLDWKLLARSDRAYVRLAEDRAILATWLLVDASASMHFPLATAGKWRMATSLSVALASIAIAAGDPVGLLVAHATSAIRHSPRARRGALADIAATLQGVTPEGTAPLAPLLADVRPGSRLVIISDFLGDEPELRRAARALASAACDVQAVHVVARDELEPPATARRMVDPEDPTVARPFDAERRAAYQERFARWRSELARAWREAGAGYALVEDGDDPGRAVRRIVRANPADLAREERRA